MGWFFASWLSNDSAIPISVKANNPITLDLENANIGNTSFQNVDSFDGSKHEGWVAAALYDIIDPRGENGNDDIHNQEVKLWRAFASNDAQTILEFETDWDELNYPSLNSIFALNTIRENVGNSYSGSKIAFEDNFNTSFSKWNLSGDDDWEIQRLVFSSGLPEFANESYGYEVARVSNCDDKCIMTESDSLNLDDYYELYLNFWYYVSDNVDFERNGNEGLLIEGSTNGGRTWSEIEYYYKNNGATGNWEQIKNIDISKYASSDFKLRVTAISSSGSEYVQIAELQLRGEFAISTNKDPILDSIGSKTIQERQNLSFTVSATDSDRPSQTLRYSIADTPPPSPIPDNIILNPITGAFSWTPNDRQKGFHSYIFTVTDSEGATDSETISITVTAIPDSSPNKTTKPTSSSITSTSATINWNAPSPGTSPITGYDIFREASPKVLIATVPSTQLSYVDNTVLPSTTYQYTVSAKNQHGSGSQSDPITITTLADTIKPVIVPTPPNSITLIRGDVYSELGAVCTDNIDGNISNVIIATNINTAIPGVYQVTYDCQDTAGNNAVTVTRTVNVVIPQVPPVLSAISDITVNEGDTKSFTVLATDENNDTITYALINSPPWAAISGSTVTISTPVELSGSSYAATVTATDDDGTDAESFFITINEVNQSPSLDNISDVESEQNKQISFTITATDPDTPAQSLSYSMTDNPVGTVLDSNTGAFTWTPNESQTGIHSTTFGLDPSRVGPVAYIHFWSNFGGSLSW